MLGRSERRGVGGPLRGGVLAVIAVELGIFLVYAFADGPAALRDHVALTPSLAFREPWQLVTSLLLHLDARDLIGSLVGVWIFGSPLERLWDRRGLIRFLAGTGLFANLAMALWGGSLPVGGLAPSAVALVVAFGLLFGESHVVLYGLLSLKGKHLAYFALGLTALASLTGGAGVNTVGLAAGGIAGVLQVTGLWRPSRWTARIAGWRARRRLRVLDGGRGSSRRWN